eukprot:1175516-Prorocentrum_minimum.AAC.1
MGGWGVPEELRSASAAVAGPTQSHGRLDREVELVVAAGEQHPTGVDVGPVLGGRGGGSEGAGGLSPRDLGADG